MRSAHLFVLLASSIALAHAFPGARDSIESMEIEDKDDGVVLVLPVRKSIFDEQMEQDTPQSNMWSPFRFSSNPFDVLMLRMQMAINKIRSQLTAAVAASAQGGVPWRRTLPEGANTTSTSQIIGDKLVTINQTTYHNSDKFGNTNNINVNVVEVKPIDGLDLSSIPGLMGTNNTEPEPEPEIEEDTREELTTPASRSVETVEEIDNEIPKSQVDNLSA